MLLLLFSCPATSEQDREQTVPLKHTTTSTNSAASFTLIELLVVVAIMAILLATLLPALAGARETARQVVCMSNLREIDVGILFYSQDSNDWLPTVTGLWQGVARQVGTSLPDLGNPNNWATFRSDLVPSILFCPSDPDPFPQPYMHSALELTSYMANGTDTNLAMGQGRDLQIGLFGGKGKRTAPSEPAVCMLLGENCNYDRVLDCDHPAAQQAAAQAGATLDMPTRRRMHHRATSAFYHGRKMNVLFADGHCRPVPGEPAQPLPQSEQPTALQSGGDATKFTYFADIALQSATQAPRFWGPPYDSWPQ